jgi:hypothetical protein
MENFNYLAPFPFEGSLTHFMYLVARLVLHEMQIVDYRAQYTKA